MEEIISNVYDYNSVIVDINNSDSWNELSIPHELLKKKQKIEYKIFQSILEYAIKNSQDKPTNLIVSSIYEQYFKIEQLININSFKTFVIYLVNSRHINVK